MHKKFEVFNFVVEATPIDFGNWLHSEFESQYEGVIPLNEDYSKLLYLGGEVILPSPSDGILHHYYEMGGSLLLFFNSNENDEESSIESDYIFLGVILSVEMRILSKERIQAICTCDRVEGDKFWDFINRIQTEIIKVFKPFSGKYCLYDKGQFSDYKIENNQDWENIEQKDKFLKDDFASEKDGQIPDKNWDRLAVKMWLTGYTSTEIADNISVSPRRVTNKISELRQKYGQEIVPYDKDRRKLL